MKATTMKHTISLLLILGCMLAFGSRCSAIDLTRYRELYKDRPGWWIGYGSCGDLQVTALEAQRQVLLNARRNAVDEAGGVFIGSVSLLDMNVIKGDVKEMRTFGMVLKDSTLAQGKNDKEYSDQNRKILGSEYWIVLACSVVVRESSKATFSVRATLDKPVYVSGEAGVLEVLADQDCYLTIFAVGADGSMGILVPNEFDRVGFIEACETYHYPPQKLQGDIALRFFTLPGDPENTEYLKVIATKTRRPFLGGFGKGKIETIKLSSSSNATLAFIRDPDAARDELYRWYFSIPEGELAEDLVMYRVMKK